MTGICDIQVAALARVHIVVNGTAACGLRDIDERDLYPLVSALSAWNDGPIPQCGSCAQGLMARYRS